jgi:hypothetical protein
MMVGEIPDITNRFRPKLLPAAWKKLHGLQLIYKTVSRFSPLLFTLSLFTSVYIMLYRQLKHEGNN